VEREARQDGNGAGACAWPVLVAVDGWFKDPLSKGAAPQPGSTVRCEHELVVVPLEVVAQNLDQKWRQRDDAGRGCGLRVAEPLFVGALVQCAEPRVDDQDAAVEVQVVAVRSGEFAPSAAGPGGGDDQQLGGVAAECLGLVGDAEDFVGCGPDAFVLDVWEARGEGRLGMYDLHTRT
jgi:hypothetical protein